MFSSVFKFKKAELIINLSILLIIVAVFLFYQKKHPMIEML